MSSIELRSQVVSALREAADNHLHGRFDRLSSAYDQLAVAASRVEDLDTDVQVALHFLDGWYDSSNHGWAIYEPIECDDWPRLAFN